MEEGRRLLPEGGAAPGERQLMENKCRRRRRRKNAPLYNLSVSLMTNVANMDDRVGEKKELWATVCGQQAEINIWQYTYMMGIYVQPASNMWGSVQANKSLNKGLFTTSDDHRAG